jgi:hypothetical protein
MIAWFGNFLILSSVIQENLRVKSLAIDDEVAKSAIEKISGFMPIFHIVWLGLVIGAAFVGVS